MELEDLYIHAGNKFRIQSILRGFACTYNKNTLNAKNGQNQSSIFA